MICTQPMNPPEDSHDTCIFFLQLEMRVIETPPIQQHSTVLIYFGIVCIPFFSQWYNDFLLVGGTKNYINNYNIQINM